jgi:hypothetical protein
MPVRTYPASHRVIAHIAQSNVSALGALALDNPQSALQNPLFGKGYFLGMPVSKKARHANAVKNETFHRNKYLECKQKQINKGQTVFPEGKKCKKQYNKWQKWRGKQGERAMKVAEKAERKGRLDPEAKAFLDADLARAMGQDSDAAMAMAASGDPNADAYLAEDYSVDQGSWIMPVAIVGTLGVAAAIGVYVMTRD